MATPRPTNSVMCEHGRCGVKRVKLRVACRGIGGVKARRALMAALPPDGSRGGGFGSLHRGFGGVRKTWVQKRFPVGSPHPLVPTPSKAARPCMRVTLAPLRMPLAASLPTRTFIRAPSHPRRLYNRLDNSGALWPRRPPPAARCRLLIRSRVLRAGRGRGSHVKRRQPYVKGRTPRAANPGAERR